MSEEKVFHGNIIDSDSDVPLLGKEKSLPFYTQGLGHEILSNPAKSVNDDGDQDLICKDQSTKDSRCQKSLKILSSLTIEALMFIYMFGFMIRSVVTGNMIMDKACRFRLNYSQEVCGNLSNHTEEKAEVEKIANDFGLYINLIHMGPAALIMIFLGPWSDRYGRKPPLMLTLVGALLDDVGTILNAIFFDAKLEYMLLSSVPSGISGGFICFLTILFSLVSEGTTNKTRTVKFAFLELALGLAMTCGSLAGGLIYKFANSYTVVYSTSAAGHVISGLWVVLLITETKGLNSEASWKQKFCDAFSFERVIEGFKVCMKVRENHGRAQIWLLFVCAFAIVLQMASFANIGFTYVHHRYNWDPTTYSYVSSLSSALGLIAMVICVPLFIRICKMRDSTLGIIGTLSSMAKNVCIGLAFQPWIYYMGNTLGLLYGIATLSTRSMLSKLVPADELGKVFSFLSTCESLVPVAGSVAMTKIFDATISVFPGLCYLIGAVVLVLPLGIYIWLGKLKSNEYQILKSKEDDFPPVPGKA